MSKPKTTFERRKKCKNPSPFRGEDEVNPQALINETWDYYWAEFKGRERGNRRAMFEGDCAYRTEDGYGCSIGRLIPDERYEFNMEGVAVGSEIVPIDLLPNIEGLHKDAEKEKFYTKMQEDLHDEPRNYEEAKTHVESFVREMNNEFELQLNVPYNDG